MEPFKNLFSPQLVSCLADHLQKHVANFDRQQFEKSILAKLEGLELKDRAQLIADHVHGGLPENHDERARVLGDMLHPDAVDGSAATSDEDGICGWGILPLTMVVGQHGIEDFERSLILLKEMTKRFSSEFGVRYFLLEDQERALTIMTEWVDDPNVHVRRLVSEGTRPRLPWAMRLPRLVADPSPILPILETLRDDEEEYVRRSVANHLNDISKDHPDLVAHLAKKWLQGGGRGREKLVRHACRTLIKNGHEVALGAFGLGVPKIELIALTLETPEVKYGGALVFSADLHSLCDKSQPLMIDYLVHFRKANGKLASKVFKWTKFDLQPGEFRRLKRSHPIRPITTRRYHGGKHGLSLRINGQDFGYVDFDLIMSEMVE